jgi:hypothetical protein
LKQVAEANPLRWGDDACEICFDCVGIGLLRQS